MKSRTGLMAAEAVSLRAARMPTGTATMMAMTAAMMISARVCIEATHWSIVMMKNKVMRVPTAICHDRKSQPMSVSRMMMASGWGGTSAWVRVAGRKLDSQVTASKEGATLAVVQSNDVCT